MFLQPVGGQCSPPDEPPITLLLFASARERVHLEVLAPIFSRRHTSRKNDNLRHARHGPKISLKYGGGDRAKRREIAPGGGRQDQVPHAAKPTAPLVVLDGRKQLHPALPE